MIKVFWCITRVEGVSASFLQQGRGIKDGKCGVGRGLDYGQLVIIGIRNLNIALNVLTLIKTDISLCGFVCHGLVALIANSYNRSAIAIEMVHIEGCLGSLGTVGADGATIDKEVAFGIQSVVGKAGGKGEATVYGNR